MHVLSTSAGWQVGRKWKMFNLKSESLWLTSNGKSGKLNGSEVYSLRKEILAYLNNTPCHCFRHLAQVDRSIAERTMWTIIHVVDFIALIFLATTAWTYYTQNPLVTTLHDTIYPIKNIPFPAVSICSNNRISRSEAQKYAKELSEKDDGDRDEFYFLKELLYLGRIYDYETENEHLVTAFQQFLDTTFDDKANGNASFGFENIITRLTPKCEDILIRCFFNSKQFKCLTPYQMMETRRNQYGFCCSFNYLQRNDDNGMNYAYHSFTTGPDTGLILVMNVSSDDYFYSLFNSVGFNIQIHNPNEFPDSTSGSVVERFVGPGQEIFLRVDATSIRSAKDILGYKADKRQCLFADENKRYGGKYTRSECIVNCKIRSLKALCDCIPFNLPPPQVHTERLRICALQHVSCLNKYKIKWSTIMSQLIEIEGLEREMEESLICAECYPSCSDNKYRVSTSFLPLVTSRRTGFGITSNITNVTDISVIRVFFGQPETWQYKQDVSNYWFEIFSNIGGLCGIVGGFSLISLTEILYFAAKQLLIAVMNRTNIHWRGQTLQIYP